MDPTDTVRVVSDDLTEDPFAIVYLKGTKSPQAFDIRIPRRVTDGTGHLRPDCQVEIAQVGYNCAEVMSGKLDQRLKAAAKRELTAAMTSS